MWLSIPSYIFFSSSPLPCSLGFLGALQEKLGRKLRSKARWMNLIKIAQQVRERAERRTLPF